MSQSVERATQLIELVAGGEHTLREIAEHVGVHRSTVFRQLQTLQRAGFLLRRDDGTWGVGMRFVALAEQALDSLDLPRIARPAVLELHRQVGNTVHVAQLVEDRVVYVAKVEDPDGVRMSSRVGRAVRPARTGVGKAILAGLPADRRAALLERTEPGDLPADLDAQLGAVRADGWAVDDGENEDFVHCVAVPVTSSTGRIRGAVSISAIKAVHDRDALHRDLGPLLAAADDIRRQLG